LGQGGFGVVKKAKWRGSDIAIKILYSTNDKNTIEMFQKEAELLIKLR
jgi:predicted Ser/Thr protein kinase